MYLNTWYIIDQSWTQFPISWNLGSAHVSSRGGFGGGAEDEKPHRQADNNGEANTDVECHHRQHEQVSRPDIDAKQDGVHQILGHIDDGQLTMIGGDGGDVRGCDHRGGQCGPLGLPLVLLHQRSSAGGQPFMEERQR